MGFRMDYRYNTWIGDDDLVLVRMDDPTFQKHKREYYHARGLPQENWSELVAKLKEVTDQQFMAFEKLKVDKEYWLNAARSDSGIYLLDLTRRQP